MLVAQQGVLSCGRSIPEAYNTIILRGMGRIKAQSPPLAGGVRSVIVPSEENVDRAALQSERRHRDEKSPRLGGVAAIRTVGLVGPRTIGTVSEFDVDEEPVPLIVRRI